MQFKTHIDKIQKFLIPYYQIWDKEILNFYPDSLPAYPTIWIDLLDRLSKEDLWKIDCKIDYSTIEGSCLANLISEIKELITLPYFQSSKIIQEIILPRDAFLKIKKKKRHEIIRLAPIISHLKKQLDFSHLVDIGGGVGHLSRIMAQYFNIQSICLDNNKTLQDSGYQNLTKFSDLKTAECLKFINLDFKQNNNFQEVFNNNSFSIGLHTCGHLAIKHINTSMKFSEKGLLNFGCCYLKLNPQTDINISKYASKNPLNLSPHALTLATRSHTETTFQDFLLKQRVKYYRYALHLLFYHQYGIEKFLGVGDSKAKLYFQDFATYANTKMQQQAISNKLSSKQLNSFFQSKKIQSLIRRMFLANIIRWQFGRVIEHYILTDRCLYLEENGYHTEMHEYFDEKISPRNIGIMAIKKGHQNSGGPFD